MKKVFFVSREFPFHLVIYPGCGPAYGRAFGWSVRAIDEIGSADCEVGIVENRLQAADLAHLDRFLARPCSQRFPLFFKLSDPEMPLSKNEGVRWIFAQRDRPGVHFLSVYDPAGPLAEALAGMKTSRVARAPFPYDRSREVERPLAGRRRRVFLAGADDPHLYPFRSAMFRRCSRNPLARLALAPLPHPGYPDIGARRRHDVIGTRFIERAAQCTHFFLDPSRYGVELMKYNECAYAGAVPLGEIAPSLEVVAGSCFVRSDGKTLDLLRRVRRPLDELAAIATGFREALRTARDPARLDAALDVQLRAILRA